MHRDLGQKGLSLLKMPKASIALSGMRCEFQRFTAIHDQTFAENLEQYFAYELADQFYVLRRDAVALQRNRSELTQKALRPKFRSDCARSGRSANQERSCSVSASFSFAGVIRTSFTPMLIRSTSPSALGYNKTMAQPFSITSVTI